MSERNDERVNGERSGVQEMNTRQKAFEKIVATLDQFRHFSETVGMLRPKTAMPFASSDDVFNVPMNILMSDPCLWEAYRRGWSDRAHQILVDGSAAAAAPGVVRAQRARDQQPPPAVRPTEPAEQRPCASAVVVNGIGAPPPATGVPVPSAADDEGDGWLDNSSDDSDNWSSLNVVKDAVELSTDDDEDDAE